MILVFLLASGSLGPLSPNLCLWCEQEARNRIKISKGKDRA